MIWYLIFGISIGIVLGFVSMYFILEYISRKMFMDKPYKKRAELFPNEIKDGLEEELAQKKINNNA